MADWSYRLRSFSRRLHLGSVILVVRVDKVDVAVGVEVVDVHPRLVVLVLLLRRLNDQDVADLQGDKTAFNTDNAMQAAGGSNPDTTKDLSAPILSGTPAMCTLSLTMPVITCSSMNTCHGGR